MSKTGFSVLAIVAGVVLRFLAPALAAGPTSLASFVAVAEAADEGAQWLIP